MKPALGSNGELTFRTDLGQRSKRYLAKVFHSDREYRQLESSDFGYNKPMSFGHRQRRIHWLSRGPGSAVPGHPVVGLDNYNDCYSPALKRDRDLELRQYPNFVSLEGDLADLPFLQSLFDSHAPQKVCTWRPRPGCATPWSIPLPIENPTWMGSSISWRWPNGFRCSAWFIPPAPASMPA
jgi:hypothetical protein